MLRIKTDEEFSMTFAEWLNYAVNANLEVTEEGRHLPGDVRYYELRDRYYELWEGLRRHFVLIRKERLIAEALEAIKAAGYKCWLSNYDNAHIQAVSKHGKKMSYYAGTGTIVGYFGTPVQGIEDFIDLLGRI